MRYITLIVLLLLLITGCSKFLDKKSDLNLATPSTYQDLEALLGNASSMNSAYAAAISEVASDNVFITNNTWGSITIDVDRSPHIWDKMTTNSIPWTFAYSRILLSNLVLEKIEDLDKISEESKNKLKGRAYFFKALSYFDLLILYSESYDAQRANEIIGVPIRRKSDVEEILTRNSLAECLEQIKADLSQAELYLTSIEPEFPTLPSLAAVFGLFSKYYLMIKDYENAYNYANKCLDLKGELLNYNTVTHVKYPFERYNEEVIFYYLSSGNSVLAESIARIDPNLYNTYAENDLRKTLFFTKNADGYYMFTGDYARYTGTNKFCGITTAEILLNRAESLTRTGKDALAIIDLKRLMTNRYTALDTEIDNLRGTELLNYILAERRKELVFRGVRWFDLKRLSAQEIGAQQISRIVEEGKHSISIEELKNFRFTIPQTVLDNSDFTP